MFVPVLRGHLRRHRSVAVMLGVAASIATLSAGVEPVPAPSGRAARPPSAAAKPALSFTGQVAPMLSRHCGGCHIAGRKGGFQMASYAGLMRSGVVQPGAGESSKLVEVILNGDMPRGGGKVSPADVGLLMKWIDAGAPFDGPDPAAHLDGIARQTTASPPAAPPTKPIVAVKLKAGEVSFGAEVAPVLLEHCVGCHDADQPEANLSMVSLDRLLRGGRGGPPIVTGKGAESLLVKKLKGTGIDGQRMPLGKQPLADDVIAMIEKWIDQGAQLDLLTPESEIDTVAAAGRSHQLSHDTLRKVRFAAGASLWSQAIADETPGVLERGDVLVIGNLPASQLDELAALAEAVDRRLRAQIGGGDGPLIKGGIVVYGFAKGYDLSGFWQTVLADERPKGLTATAGVSGDVVYAAVVPPSGARPAGTKVSGSKVSGDRGTGDRDAVAADTRLLLTEQMVAAALLGRGVPAWFARGAGRAVAMKAEPKADLVKAWRRELPAALQRTGTPADFFDGHGDPVAAAVVGGGFVEAIMPTASRLESLVRQLDAETPFDQAFVTLFRSTPQAAFESWAARASRAPKR